MKTSALSSWVAALLALSAAAALAQSAEPASTNVLDGQTVQAAPAPAPWITYEPPPPPASRLPDAHALAFQSALLSRVMGVPVLIEGPLPTAVKSRQPWQLLNPWAPPEFGYGQVTVDERRRSTTGLSIIAIKF
jgi:hypothetical protein